MVRGDLQRVLAIESVSNPSPWHEGDFLPFLPPAGGPEDSDPRRGAVKTAWVYSEGSDVLGFACVAGVTDEVELQAVAVDPACRGRGIGAALMEALVEWAREAGYRVMHLEVRAGNVPALGLYRNFGFTQVGLRRGYYQDNGEDALLLSREIQRA